LFVYSKTYRKGFSSLEQERTQNFVLISGDDDATKVGAPSSLALVLGCSGIVSFGELGAEFFLFDCVDNIGDYLGSVRFQTRTGGQTLPTCLLAWFVTLSFRHNPASAEATGMQYRR
jgi:hypothetical protein